VTVVQGAGPDDIEERLDAVQWPTFFDQYHVTDAPPLQITYRFGTERPGDLRAGSWTDVAGWGSYTEAERGAVRQALDIFADHLNVTFVESASEGAVDLSFLRASQGVSGGRGRFQYSTGTDFEYDGFVLFNTNRDMSAAEQMNLILHEIGHAFSLKHPGNYDVNPANAPPGPYLPTAEDNYQFTVMSYSENPQISARPDTLMLYDIAALQERWGANMSHQGGDDHYQVRADGNLYVVWDTGGTDRITAEGSSGNAVIDLREGHFSELGLAGNTPAARIAVGYGSVIEEATGQSGHDRLQGNAADNMLFGEDGNDTLLGEAGNDTLRGGDGSDELNGGAGDDFIFGGETEADLRDVIFGGEGNDSIHGGYGNDELRGDAGNDSIEGGFGVDTVIGGDGDDVLTGSAWSDLIFGGNGNDFINGGFGHDRVNGGEGADKFYHLGIFDHGSDWIQDYDAAEGDVLFWGGAPATANDFQVNTADTPDAGVAGVSESFIIYRPTGQIMWALVDGDAQSSINIQIAGQTFDLMS
jgi:serralysin